MRTEACNHSTTGHVDLLIDHIKLHPVGHLLILYLLVSDKIDDSELAATHFMFELLDSHLPTTNEPESHQASI